MIQNISVRGVQEHSSQFHLAGCEQHETLGYCFRSFQKMRDYFSFISIIVLCFYLMEY